MFTTTFDGYLVALARESGRLAWRRKLPAFTNAPIAIRDDTLITAASFPGGKGQTTEVIAFRLGAHGPLVPPAPSEARAEAEAGRPTAPRSSARTARPATRWRPRTPREPSDRTSTT